MTRHAEVNDQNEYWEQWHCKNSAEDTDPVHLDSLALFSELLQPIKNNRVLELGCGQGYDAVSLALEGYDVIAADLSTTALQHARELAKKNNVSVKFTKLDISQPPFPWPDDYFSGVFSYLSLHYFSSATTRDIFADIRRIISPGGAFVFVVRSTRDPIFGRGEEIEPEMFLLNGHVRHFFTVPYSTSVMEGWQVLKVEELVGHYLSPKQPGGFVRVSARPLRLGLEP